MRDLTWSGGSARSGRSTSCAASSIAIATPATWRSSTTCSQNTTSPHSTVSRESVLLPWVCCVCTCMEEGEEGRSLAVLVLGYGVYLN